MKRCYNKLKVTASSIQLNKQESAVVKLNAGYRIKLSIIPSEYFIVFTQSFLACRQMIDKKSFEIINP